ncbi:MAG TPA: hypothetical protein PLB36_00960 [Bacillota bacterium]|nr:hypothetical protein [Bacillota bacterium]HOK63874.1 hypothetical protein [Bacillota bacterium]HOL11438.1 hypothetical protein [Bacillota bacterium]HPP61313.1 hypothetical protein [Bacillota bacterium]HQD74922.1 hypothetical protein [Bacillota bacterium]
MDLKITDVQPILKEPRTSAPRQVGHKDGSFADALREAQANVGVSFSKHAEQRLNEWGKVSKDEYIEDLSSAMDMAQAKGAKSTLVVTKGAAFLVAPQTRTVVTVVPEDRMRENLFTSIDSAVLMDE